MSTVQVICMILGVCLLMFLAYKGMNLFLATVLCALFVCFTNGIPWTDGVIAGYAAAFSGFVQSNLFVIVTGAIFGQMMSSSGCAESIALKVLGMLGRKRMLLGLLLVNMLFCYVGIAGFVVIFTIAPLAIIMFEKAQLPRWMIPTVTSLGTSIGCGVLPYSLDILNYTPTRFLGTTLGAAPLLGFVAGGVTFAFRQVDIVPAVAFIGCVTLVLSAVGVKVGNVFGARFKSKAELFGGVVLCLMGLKILLEHLGVFG